MRGLVQSDWRSVNMGEGSVLRVIGAIIALLLATGAGGPGRHHPPAIRSVEVAGTAFRVAYANGRTVVGRDLEGAILTLTLRGSPRPLRIRLDRIVPDPDDGDILLHRITDLPDRGAQAAHDLCEPDAHGERWAFPLRGQWDDRGRRTADRALTLVCVGGGGIGKCVRWGYKPWAVTAAGIALAPYHAACVNMVSASYCGGRGTTRDGMTIDFWDTVGVNHPDDAAARLQSLRFEAGWSPLGAVCVAHTRVPAHVTLESLARSCPYLRGRLGDQNCVAERATRGHYGSALIFNRSQ